MYCGTVQKTFSYIIDKPENVGVNSYKEKPRAHDEHCRENKIQRVYRAVGDIGAVCEKALYAPSREEVPHQRAAEQYHVDTELFPQGHFYYPRLALLVLYYRELGGGEIIGSMVVMKNITTASSA